MAVARELLKTMRTGFLVLTTLLGAGAIGGLLYWHQSRAEPTAEGPAQQPQTIPVVAGPVKNGPVPIYLRGVGTVIAYNNVVVRSQITGPLIKVSFRQGETVHKGDLLGEIDPRPYQAQLDQAIANRDRDQAQVQNAQANLNRYTPLAQQGFATTQLVDTQKAQLAQLQAMVKSDEAVIESAQVNLDYTRLTAPIDGVTGIRQIDEGNIIHPTDTNGLVDLTQIQPISLIFTLPEVTFVEIQQEMAKGPVKVFAYSQDDKTRLDEGDLLLIDNQINQTTGTIRLRATFPNGTLSGAPKIRAMQIIAELEQTARGPYGGCMGYFSFNGNLDCCITIRTALLKDGRAYVQAGGGWVNDSTPEGEYQETVNKAKAMLKAVAMAENFSIAG